MNIAWLCPEIIVPADSGGRIVQYERLRYVSELGHKITLYLFDNHRIDDSANNELGKLCKSVVPYDYSTKKTETLIKSFASRRPYCVLKFYNKQISEQIKQGVNQGEVDLIIVEFPFLLVNLTAEIINKCPTVLEQHNVEWMTMHSIAVGATNNPLRKLFGKTEAAKLRRFESNSYRTLNLAKMTFLTQDDMDQVNSFGVDKVLTPPGGLDFFSDLSVRSGSEVSFIANFGYQPNQVSAKWIVEKVIPRVIKDYPNVRFNFVGKNPPQWLSSLSRHDGRVTVTGRVDDLGEWYRKSTVIIVPVTTGGGVKIKLLEAASSGRIIIATPFSVKGTVFTDKEHLIIKEKPAEFAEAIISALNNPMQYLPMIEKCRRTYLENYSWSAVNEAWFQQVLNAINR